MSKHGIVPAGRRVAPLCIGFAPARGTGKSRLVTTMSNLIALAQCAAPPQVDQRNVATAGGDPGREIGAGLVAAVPASQQDANERGGQCGS